MQDNSGFLVEDFVQALTEQLDRVQDILRLKALNRPLTYALRDFSLDLSAFVDMDAEGNVRLRASGPNEAGASTIRLGFTTITRPMIEENTVTLSMTRSPSLQELGLAGEEKRRLEQLGVHTAAQLRQLRSSTGTRTVSRLAGIPMDRLRQALQRSRPQVRRVQPVGEGDSPPRAQRPQGERQEPAFNRSPQPQLPPTRPATPGHSRGAGPTLEHLRDIESARAKVPGLPTEGVISPTRTALPIEKLIEAGQPSHPRRTVPATPQIPGIRLAPGTKRIRLSGQNLIGPQGPPVVRLNSETLGILDADEDQVVVDMPQSAQEGLLEIELPDGQMLGYELSFESHRRPEEDYDPWAPVRGGG